MAMPLLPGGQSLSLIKVMGQLCCALWSTKLIAQNPKILTLIRPAVIKIARMEKRIILIPALYSFKKLRATNYLIKSIFPREVFHFFIKNNTSANCYFHCLFCQSQMNIQSVIQNISINTSSNYQLSFFTRAAFK